MRHRLVPSRVGAAGSTVVRNAAVGRHTRAGESQRRAPRLVEKFAQPLNRVGQRWCLAGKHTYGVKDETGDVTRGFALSCGVTRMIATSSQMPVARHRRMCPKRRTTGETLRRIRIGLWARGIFRCSEEQYYRASIICPRRTKEPVPL